jgi:uncharacterized protein YecT (DUF1311 family)
MRFLLILFCIALQLKCFAQQSDTKMIKVTEKVQLQLKQEVEKEVPAFKKHLVNNDDTASIAFMVDTFRVERFEAKWLKLNYSDYSMSMAVNAAAKMYDDLLNKYYRKLMKVLNTADKKKLVEAQKAWLAYRDSEDKVLLAVDNEAYSGGSMEALADASSWADLVKQRTIMLFNYYEVICQR